MSAISVEPPFAKQDNIGWTYAPVVPTSGATATGVGIPVLTQALPAGVWSISASIFNQAVAGDTIARTGVFFQLPVSGTFFFVSSNCDDV